MNNSIKHQKSIVGIDLGDRKHAICAIDQEGKELSEHFIRNRRDDLEQLSRDYPGALIALEVGTHSPWISRLLESLGHKVIVANSRKLRAIYTNERKSDEQDARMLAKLARVDPELLHPVKHGSEQAQQDLVLIKLRDTLVRQRVDIVTSIRFTLKSLGIRLKSPNSAAFANYARKALCEHPEILS
ncbi:transposase, partial [Verrucomicrobiaceae bacterium R5-34]|nr:transposase [Verrucomicrobiaceae bacterium R5-34]